MVEISSKQKIIVLLIVAILVIAGVFAFRSYLVPLSTGGNLAVSSIYIDPLRPGNQQGNEWVGGHWVVLSTTYTAYGTHCFYQFDLGQVNQFSNGNTTNKGPAGQILLPNASIQLSVTVGQPYLKSDLIEYDNMEVLPATYGTHYYAAGLITDSYWKEYYTYSGGSWTLHNDGPTPQQNITYWRTMNNWMAVVPLDVTATKIKADGTQIALLGPGGTTTYHTEATGSSALLPFSFTNPQNSTETIGFQLQGLLSSGITPNAGPFFILRNPDYIFTDSQNIETYIKFSADSRAFVNDWYGPNKWSSHSDGTINVGGYNTQDQWDAATGYPGLATIHTDLPTPFQTQMWWYPNEVNYDQLMFSGAPYPIASGRPSSLATYLAKQIGAPLTATQINPYTGQFVVDTTSKVMKLMLDQNAYLWLYTVDISTQLADTYVWRPSYTTGSINSAQWLSGQTVPHIPVGISDSMQFGVQNTGTYPGALTLKFTMNPANAPLSVSSTTVSIAGGVTQTVAVPVTNLGTTTDLDVKITASLWNGNNEHQGSDVTLECILSASTGSDVILTVTTQNKDGLYISGINVAIQYGTQSTSGFTGNGVVTFDLGLYTGSVSISTAETDAYLGWSGQVTVTHSMTYPITLTAKGQPTPGVSWYIIGMIAGVVAVIVAIGIYEYRRRKRAA